MKSIYSIIRFINNPLSNENIAFGVVVISDGEILYRFSEDKINFISKLNPSVHKLMNFSIEKLKKSLDIGSKEEGKLIKSEILFSEEYLERLSVYNNGVIQFDKPTLINLSLKGDAFDNFFQKYISLKVSAKNRIRVVSELKSYIKSNFYIPLEKQIDVDYILEKKQIPSLYFNYHFDGLGINGSIFSAKSIDLNSNRPISEINKDISEFESVNQRLDAFASSKGISAPSKNYLIIDEYKGHKISYLDLYSILSKENSPYFELIGSTKVPEVVNKIIADKKIRKFSKEFSGQ